MLTKAKLIQNKVLFEDIHELWINLEQEIKYVPGQYVLITCDKQKRAFSIVSSRINGQEIRLIIKQHGEFTKHFLSMEIAELDVQGPFGRFVLGENKKTLLIAGGIGVTPIFNMISETLVKPNDDHNIILYYSAMSRDAAVLKEEFDKIPKSSKFIKNYIFTAEGGIRLSANQLMNEVHDISERDIFLCGPPPMINAIREGLIGRGIKAEKIHSEEFNTIN